jgi:catechol 2,3-dioxygenase-like lactoylglutathione lyase family enzyme
MLETSIKTTGIDHTVLHVSDLPRSKKFYMDVLGMTMNHEDATHAFLWCGAGQQVALFEVPEGKTVTAGDDLNHMALRMESGTYEEVKGYLEQNGAKVFGRPGDEHCIYFNDPDGHRLQLLHPGEH